MTPIYVQAPALPVTSVTVILPRTGACLDPAARQGLMRLMLRLQLMGAGGKSNMVFNSALERLGATLSHTLTSDYIALRLVTLSENLEPALTLFHEAIHAPNFDTKEFERLKAESISSWIAEREENKQLRAQETYLHRIYNETPHGFLPDGTLEGLQRVTLDEVRAHYPTIFGWAEPIVAVLSDLPEPDVAGLLAERLQLPKGSGQHPRHPWDRFAPEFRPGRHLTIIDDPGTQTDEVLMGAFSVDESDPDWHVHRLISLIFGGDMNSRLFRVLRGERGLSYGASCWYESTHGRSPRNRISPFSLYTFPSAEHTAEALPLMVSLYEELVAEGVREDELSLSKQALINSYPFMLDAPHKLLSLRCDTALYGIEPDDEQTHRDKISSVDPAKIRDVLQRTHHPDTMTMVLLGDAKRLEAVAAGLPGITSQEVISGGLPHLS